MPPPHAPFPVAALACTPPPNNPQEPPWTNPHVGTGPLLSCPMDFAAPPSELGLPDLPIDADQARQLAEDAHAPESLTWSQHPEGSPATSQASWSLHFPDEPVPLSLKRPRADGTLLSSPSCEAGAAWFVPVNLTVAFDNGLLLEAPTGIRVFDDGRTPEEVRFAAVVTAPLDLFGDLADLVQAHRGVAQDAILEAYLSGAVTDPSVAVSAYSERAAVNVWRSDTDDTVPCDPAYGHPCSE